MRRCVILGLIGLLLLVSDSSALEPLEPPDLDQYLRWGPLRVRPGLRVYDVGYDDNIFFAVAEPVSDYRMTVAPRLEGLVLLGSRAFLTFDETLRFSMYIENEDQNYVENLTSARLTVPVERLGVFVETRIDRRQERPIDRLDERLQRDETGYRFGVVLEPGWRTTLEMAVGTLRMRHNDPDALDPQQIADRLDRDERSLTLEATYRLFGRARATLFAENRRLDFLAATDTESWSIQPGIDFGLGGPLRGSVRIGWSSISGGSQASRPQLSEPVGRAELAWTVGRGLVVQFDAERRPGFTFRSASYYVDGSYNVRAVRYLNRLIGVELGGGIGRLSFLGAPADEYRRDRITSYGVGVRLRLSDNSIGRRIEYGLRVGRWRRESTNRIEDQERTTVVLNATIGY